jgi:hypothetical protein
MQATPYCCSPCAGRRQRVRERVVLHGCVLEDRGLDVVVRGEVAQVHESGATHVRPATPPQALPARVAHNLAKVKQAKFKF